MEILVFATSVQSADQVRILAPQINSLAGKGRWNFALDDSDKILRIASDRVNPQQAVALLEKYGFECNELD
ncbi:MAG: hypothetical protein ACOVMQ_07000 [Cyclobacteriaceae bacterium]|jgi:hypothetical protein